jgi:hypothetical protein
MPEKRLMARKALDVSSQRKTLGGGFKSSTEGSIWRHRGVLFQTVSVTGATGPLPA